MNFFQFLYNKIRFMFVNPDALHPAEINVDNVNNYLTGYARKFITDLNLKLPEHIKEQVGWRTHQTNKKSPKCLSQNSCVNCGCKTTEKIFSDASCEFGCFPAMMDKKQWNKFKEDLRIQEKIDSLPDTFNFKTNLN